MRRGHLQLHVVISSLDRESEITMQVLVILSSYCKMCISHNLSFHEFHDVGDVAKIMGCVYSKFHAILVCYLDQHLSKNTKIKGSKIT